MEQKDELGIYLFCGIQTDQEDEFGTVEIEGQSRNIFTIHYKDAAMVVAEAPLKIYHPNKENLMFHQNTVSEVMNRNDTVIPISFGNIFKTREDVKVLLENLYPQFKKLFPEIKGKMELGLKVIGKKEWLESKVNEYEDIVNKAASVNNKSEAASYYERIQLGDFAQKMVSQIQQEIIAEIYEPLKDTAEAARNNPPHGEKMLMNASFLIDRKQEGMFDEKINAAHEKWKDKVDFKYTGPWPVYNFVNIRLSVEES
ncbi:GvpL/GvpF family gas vesicle protein [Pseudalkalibacillus sp. SCS-8]|uniref:GvpL/GvpF family gas vesicle protein n=1 Tax=Pseudalkalibacillus nanhaiensis TaxID=3115291 RepID=UPI0032DA4835